MVDVFAWVNDVFVERNLGLGVFSGAMIEDTIDVLGDVFGV